MSFMEKRFGLQHEQEGQGVPVLAREDVKLELPKGVTDLIVDVEGVGSIRAQSNGYIDSGTLQLPTLYKGHEWNMPWPVIMRVTMLPVNDTFPHVNPVDGSLRTPEEIAAFLNSSKAESKADEIEKKPAASATEANPVTEIKIGEEIYAPEVEDNFSRGA